MTSCMVAVVALFSGMYLAGGVDGSNLAFN